MSNLFGEARIEILPDTTAFRAALIKQIEAAQAGLAVTIPVAAVGAEAATAATGGVVSATRAAAAATALLEKQELQLAAAEQKALLATTPLGAARARLAGAAAAAATAESALAKATLSGDEALIADAEVVAASAAAEEERSRAVVRTIVLENARAAAIDRATTAAKANVSATAASADALRVQGAAAARAAAQDAALVASMEANAAAASHLVGIEERQALVSGNLAKARAVLASLNKSAADSQAALDAALQTGNAQFIRAQAGVTGYVVSLRELAVANVQAAIAENEEAATAARSAGAHAQATRGIVAETLALGGLRGATLAASAPFLVGATAAIIFAKSIKEASSETEELNKTAVVFGQSSQQIKEFSETTATSLGISSTEALKAAGVFGNLFRTIQISEPVSADMSQRLVQLASDLASFNNADPSRTLEALRAGLVGQARPLRVFGIFLSAARVQQQALIDTQKKSVEELTQAELVQARYNIILRDSALAQGDFARTSDRAANQSRILKAQLSDLGVDIGNVLLPALTFVIGALNDYVGVVRQAAEAGKQLQASLSKLPGPAGEAGSQIFGLEKKVAKLYFRFAVLGPVMGAATLLEKKFGDGADEAGPKVEGFAAIIAATTGAIADLSAALQTAGAKPFKSVTSQLQALEVERLKIQTGLLAGGRSAEEANLRQQIAADKKAVAVSKSGTAARKQAIQDLKSDQDDLAALLQQDASDAQDRAQKIKDAAAAQKSAADAAAKAQADATQAFIDQFTGKQQRLQNKLTNAQLFGSATQQIAINKRIVAADRAEIRAIRERIKHLKLHGDALKTAKAEIARLIQEIFNTRNDIAQLREERNQTDREARQTHLEAMLSIAETTASTRDDARAQRALIAFDKAQIARILAIKKRRRLTQDEAAQLDAYRVDLAQRTQALKGVIAEQKKSADTSKAQFEFLQTQAGFAANLLGNLIPLGATSGLVGGTTTATGTASPRQVPGGFEQPRGANAAQSISTKSSTMPSGPSRTGQARQTHLLNQILHVLNNIYRGTGHPEAHHRRRTNVSAMDTISFEHGQGG